MMDLLSAQCSARGTAHVSLAHSKLSRVAFCLHKRKLWLHEAG